MVRREEDDESREDKSSVPVGFGSEDREEPIGDKVESASGAEFEGGIDVSASGAEFEGEVDVSASGAEFEGVSDDNLVTTGSGATIGV
ncbi:hypothetical protein V6N11_031840 [Hibiscus sabdariffa]|uniref:Uncharacterized protein n=1 Tax=Hibiscus sabdariffa TaxID=183260 RepID=A0ABR2SZL1_9ROSI